MTSSFRTPTKAEIDGAVARARIANADLEEMLIAKARAKESPFVEIDCRRDYARIHTGEITDLHFIQEELRLPATANRLDGKPNGYTMRNVETGEVLEGFSLAVPGGLVCSARLA